MRVKVVTDSTADLSPETAQRLGITVVPLDIHFGTETFRDGIDLTTREFFRKLHTAPLPPLASPPSEATFHEAYAKLSRETDEAISIHISSRLSGTYRVASEVAESVLGQCRIMVMDSLTTSLALGNLAIAAAEAAQEGANLDEVVRLVRGMIPHLYLVFFVETLDYLERGARIGKAQALLGTMLGIKPLLIIEEGEIQPLEKVCTRTDALEKLFEFITEFPHIEKMTLFKGMESMGIEELLQRIETAYPDKEVDVITYGPALATYVGPRAMGVFVYEGME